MPELPDVEAVRRYLVSRGLVGRTISGAALLWPRAIREPSPEEFRANISGRRIGEVRRRGKYLVLSLDGLPPRTLVLHLGMTGSLIVQPSGEDRPRHTRNILLLQDDLEVCFVDPRKLGSMRVVADEGRLFDGLGPEPLDPAFTSDVLGERLSGRSAPIKALLCDQAVVAGIGNIYADEVLFVAGIHPLKAGGGLSDGEIGRLHEAIRRRLAEAVEALAPLAPQGGPPTESEPGLEQLLVPRSEGEPCSRCGRPIRRRTVRGRSSYFCSNDQGRESPSYRIVDYDPEWPKLFRKERAAIAAAMGIGTRRVQHIGSTSVPGLGAKPIVDIMVGVAKVPPVAEAKRQFTSLRKLGYEFRGETVPGTLYVRKASPPRSNLHMTESRGRFWTDHLLFRNYLRAHSDVAARYEELKRDLMSRMAHDIPGYNDGKEAFIRSVLDTARQKPPGRSDPGSQRG